MKRIFLMLLASFLVFTPAGSIHVAESSEEHAHEHEHEDDREHEDKKEASHDHEKNSGDHDEHKEGHGDEHGHEENSRIGPNKGIVEFNEEEGFRLSPEAIKNFGLKNLTLVDKAPWKVPETAILYSGEEVNLYRIRKEHVKRIDFKLERKEKGFIVVTGKDLVSGDQVAIEGVGFLRIAELAATGQTPDSHAH